MENFLVVYLCRRLEEPSGFLPVIRTITETDPINAIITARREERELTGVNCSDCTLTQVCVA